MTEIAYDGVMVAGVNYRLSNVLDVLDAWAAEQPVELELKPEPANPHDPHAIRVVGKTADREHHIGYLPAPLAESIAYHRRRVRRAEIVAADVNVEKKKAWVEIRVLDEG